MKILVTGGLGYIGSYLVDALVERTERGYDVVVVDDLSSGLKSNANIKASTYIEDVERYCSYNFEKFDYIFHLANNARIAKSFLETPQTLLNNYRSTVALLEYMRNTKSGKMFYASSSTTNFVDKFNNPYTFSKFTCDDLVELYRRHFNVQTKIVKFYNVYGGNREKLDGEYTTVIRKFKEIYHAGTKPLPVYGNGEKRRNFTHIDDTINGLMQILDNDLVGIGNLDCYSIGTTKNYSINDIVGAFDYPKEEIEGREYEGLASICEPNILGWEAKQDLLNYINEWKEGRWE